MPGLDDLIKCSLCNSTLKDPFQLPCTHAFCKTCLSASVSSGKITCKSCAKVHTVPSGNVEKVFKASVLAEFFLGFKGDKFATLNAIEDSVVEGVCPECSPPANKRKETDPPIPTVKLSKCVHCNKVICEKCRNKHYETQRKETVQALEKFEEGSANVKITAEQINDSRKKRIVEYGKLKNDISAKHKEILQKLKTEEEALAKQIDSEIKIEESKITESEADIKKLYANQDTAHTIKKQLSSESDVKKMSETCNAFNKIQQEWANNLKSEASRADPSKETKLVYNPPKLKDAILGGFEQKKSDAKIKQASIPGQKSGVCTIL